ncbi:hypothetical protein [Bradyrhizobium sp. SZCCHNR1093]|uniref:hypothetical protein n=1 Tax=Bradyrhizobium sp. SZCCHNR1093 TaxID=3057368 RepID=UPI0028E3A9A6|nr:hypothetical protein [Bradyrhizobium sp. SZCCHNR1093]
MTYATMRRIFNGGSMARREMLIGPPQPCDRRTDGNRLFQKLSVPLRHLVAAGSPQTSRNPAVSLQADALLLARSDHAASQNHFQKVPSSNPAYQGS